MAKVSSRRSSGVSQDLAAIPQEEFARRRREVLGALKGATGLVLAGDAGGHLAEHWRPDRHFLYLTGIVDEPGAAVLFDETNPDPRRRVVLFLRPHQPEVERWDGLRLPLGELLKHRTGFETVLRTVAMPGFLTAAVRRSKRAACLHPFSVYDAPVSGDLALFRKVSERVPGVAIEDRTQLLAGMRAVKSAAELTLMRRAAAATAEGYRAALATIGPGVSERSVQEAMDAEYRKAGASGPAYNPIVGSGMNGTVLHYKANSARLGDGELLVIDSGAQFGEYACDVTRTFPVSGMFSEEQAELYELVLEAQEAAIKAARPGVTLAAVDAAARAVIDKAGYADAFMHGIGHQLGLDVHDISPDGELAEGMVLTIEPGIYLAEKRLGIRIEDDIVVRRGGAEVITAMIPKSISEIEDAMREARREPSGPERGGDDGHPRATGRERRRGLAAR